MDDRIRTYLESDMGVALEALPARGLCIRESPARTDTPNNRLAAYRLAGCDAALVTAIPSLANTIRTLLAAMTVTELFSPLGIEEIGQAVPPQDRQGFIDGWIYTITDPKAFRPRIQHDVQALMTSDMPRVKREFGLAMRPGDEVQPEHLAWAFACYCRGEPVSIATISWNHGGTAQIAIAGTEGPYRRQGYGSTVVSAATDCILQQNRAVLYETVSSNVPALRMVRPLGFSLVFQRISL